MKKREEWLKKFYAPWLSHPIRQGQGFGELGQISNLTVIKSASGLIKDLKAEMTIEEMLAAKVLNEEAMFRAIHMLMIRRVFAFKETKKIQIFRHNNYYQKITDDPLMIDGLSLFCNVF